MNRFRLIISTMKLRRFNFSCLFILEINLQFNVIRIRISFPDTGISKRKLFIFHSPGTGTKIRGGEKKKELIYFGAKTYVL